MDRDTGVGGGVVSDHDAVDHDGHEELLVCGGVGAEEGEAIVVAYRSIGRSLCESDRSKSEEEEVGDLHCEFEAGNRRDADAVMKSCKYLQVSFIV